MTSNIIFYDNKPLREIQFKNFFDGKISDGVFSIIKKDYKKNLFLARDRYGIKKVFYTINRNKINAADNYIDLFKKTKSYNICSLKPGYTLFIDKKKGKRNFKKIKYKPIKKKIKFNSILSKNKILDTLLKIKKIEKTDECNVLLSGGLDSTIIAYLANKVFKKVNAITCVFLNETDYKKYTYGKNMNFDNYKYYVNAKKIAYELKINFFPIVISIKETLKNYNKVMYLIQDWRDFNVHCGVLNFEIAKYLKKKKFKNLPTLSGDFMNECFADYTEEIINNKIYYKQPNVNSILRSKFLINGLQSSDRENGIFSKSNLKIYQPYFCLLSNFKKLKKSFFKKFVKYKFMGKILPPKILKLVGKEKRRAQITSDDGGILNHFVSNKVDQNKLLKDFSKINKIKSSWLKSFIVFGKYSQE